MANVWYDLMGSGGSCTTATNTTWSIWASQTATTCTNQVWMQWNTIQGTGAANMANQFVGQQQPSYSQEQLAAIAAQTQANAERYAEEKKLREEAEVRAEKLLVENLSLKQRAEYAKDKHFVVERGDRRYRIRRGRMGNVDVIDKRGCVEHRLCAHPGEAVPDFDTMLAQKLMLEHDDDAFRKVANWHGSHDRTTAVLPALQ